VFLATALALVPLLPQEAVNRVPAIAAKEWLNTDRPLGNWEKDLRGQVVLLDFWTYCCINCLHILPDLAKLEKDFVDEPFLVIGVHSKKFDQEGDAENIRQAILRHGIRHPVAVDSDHAIWDSFGVRSWPTLVLVDPEGREVGRLSGEGHYATLKRAVRVVLDQHREKKTLAEGPLKVALEKPRDGTLAFPGKVLALPDSILVADSGNGQILQVATPGGNILRRWGNLNYPQGMAVLGDQLYVAETGAHRILRLQLAGDAREVVAGTGKQASFRPQEGPGLETALNSPWALEADGYFLHIAMAGSHQLWTLDSRSGELKHLAGSGRENIVDGPSQTAQLAQPSGLSRLGRQLYFADSEVSAIRVVDLEKSRVSSLVGSHLFRFGDEDGVGMEALLQHPLGLASWRGRLLVADTFNSKIKLLDPNSGACSSLFEKEWSKDGPEFWEPGGLDVHQDTLFVADTNHHRIVAVELKSGAWSVVLGEGAKVYMETGNGPQAAEGGSSP
jgi:thiol-disulfide isomerase/thioredoxin